MRIVISGSTGSGIRNCRIPGNTGISRILHSKCCGAFFSPVSLADFSRGLVFVAFYPPVGLADFYRQLIWRILHAIVDFVDFSNPTGASHPILILYMSVHSTKISSLLPLSSSNFYFILIFNSINITLFTGGGLAGPAEELYSGGGKSSGSQSCKNLAKSLQNCKHSGNYSSTMSDTNVKRSKRRRYVNIHQKRPLLGQVSWHQL